MICKRLVIGVWFLLAAGAADAQFFDRLSNPTIEITLTHPPGLGINVNRVVFLGARGKCTHEFKTALIEDFVAGRVQVAEREVIASILDEYDFAASGYVDQKSVLALGKVIGPTTLIYLEGHRCNSERNKFYKEFKRKDGTKYKVFYTRTEGFFKCGLRVIDLETASIFTAKTVEGSAALQFESQDGFPVFPSEYEVLSQALAKAQSDVKRMFFPWNETKNLVFFDNKKGGLKAAYRAFKVGNVAKALDISLENLEKYQHAPDRKPKIWAYAHYNVGMCHLVRFEYDQALTYFEAAHSIKPGGIIEETIQECRRAQDLAAEMQRVEEQAEFTPVADEHQPEPDQEPPPSETDELDDIEARLAKLKYLYEKKLLTKAEYEAKKKEILASL